MTRFFFPAQSALAEIDRGGLAGVPVLFGLGYRLLPAENKFLLERALGLWPEPSEFVRARRGMAPNTLKSIARRLHHFRDWCDLSRKPWKTLKYEHVLEYQDAQAHGWGIYDGRAVSHGTAIARADVATDFLDWAYHRDLRGPFEFAVNTTARLVKKRTSNMTFLVKSKTRVGKKVSADDDQDINRLDLPGRPAIKRWLKAVKGQRGDSKFLICRFMVDTGVRLHEAVALEARQWPNQAHLDRCRELRREYAFLRLIVTKSGTARTIRVSIGLAQDIRDWIDAKREELLKAGIEAGNAKPTDRLFLSDIDGYAGIPIQRHTVYDCFHEVEPRPEGWHPHMARHAYACHRMMDLIAAEMEADPKGKGPAWVESRGKFALDVIGSQLGHMSENTTKIYVAYLRNTVGMTTQNDDWQRSISTKVLTR